MRDKVLSIRYLVLGLRYYALGCRYLEYFVEEK